MSSWAANTTRKVLHIPIAVVPTWDYTYSQSCHVLVPSASVRGPEVFTGGVMSRNAFYNIRKFLRFSPEALLVNNQPKTRIQPFMDLIWEKYRGAIYPGEDITIDESLILFEGRLHFRQFIQ